MALLCANQIGFAYGDESTGFVIDNAPGEFHDLPFQSHLQCQLVRGKENGTSFLLMKEPRKRCFRKMEMTQEAKHTSLDLTLRLSPPGTILIQDDDDELSSHSEISSPTSQGSCLSLEMINSSQGGLDRINTSVKVASLVLMGCPHCLIYVMVSQVEPKCPMCKSTVLIDTSYKNQAKRSREC
ncbi:hypothetical protein Tsubulata_023648 [Turnera subulata]|uniref:GIR1-like zinc ribbon domain-containing protein n=1 Tax=Turnera subulata TaxID=218843 RepID=A0A9Q0J3A6_9ROSI|nr:hypothetical protein Tsubulata_023648 [Turnera subulata]